MSVLKLNIPHEFEKAYERMLSLQRVTSELSKALTKEDVAQIIINEGFKMLETNSGDIMLVEENTGEFDVIAYKGYSKDFLNEFFKAKENSPLLTSLAIEQKKPYFFENLDEIDNKYTFAKLWFKKVHAASLVILPLTSEGKMMGIMQFAFTKKQKFTQEDKNFMLTLAQQCAQAFERVIAQEKLAESKKELEIILGSVADGILVQDEGGKIVYVNKAAGKIFREISLKDIFSHPWEEFLDMFEIQDENGNVLSHDFMPGRRAISAKKPVKVTYKFIHKKSQEAHWLQIESTPILGVDKKLSISVSVFQDITRLKEIEQRKDDFISMASHELKTPLTSAKVFTQVLKTRLHKYDNEDEKLVAKIARQLDQLTGLTKDLLDITKLQKGKLDLSKSYFDIQKLVKEVIGDLQPSTEHTISLWQNESVQVYADKEKISQVITNFLTNAIKYSPKTQKIYVRIFKNHDVVKISVTDRGIGIAKQDIDKLFERFYRIEKDKKTYPGLGLGLYISSEIIKQHGGRIGVTSTLGKGSTFYFTLPVSE